MADDDAGGNVLGFPGGLTIPGPVGGGPPPPGAAAPHPDRPACPGAPALPAGGGRFPASAAGARRSRTRTPECRTARKGRESPPCRL
ncbi:hypothetical protein LT493_26095 [Streptomyces tricolor]|nr:hypothetical protein [Streptomyces tricolor]